MENRRYKYLSLKLRRYLFPILTAILIVVLYRSIDITLFSLDITKKVRLALFQLTSDPRLDESIVLLNIGRLDQHELATKIDSLLKCYPRKIGINLCHYNSNTEEFVTRFLPKKSVVIATCAEGAPQSPALIVNDDNSVTHFRADRKDYFEFKIDLFENRGNETERIYFVDPHKTFYRWELSNVALIPEYFQGKTVLVGYMGDYLTDSSYYVINNHVTPINPHYGKEQLAPDAFDTELSAIIIKQFSEKQFIDEIGEVQRILFILLCCVLNVVVLTYGKTKWNAVNILIAAIVFVLFSTASSALVLFLFTEKYYLAIDELPLVLLITTIFTVGLNIFEKKLMQGR